MTYGKKKTIIIVSVIVVVLLILVGVGLFLFLGTDLFKSNEELFYKYMGTELANYKIESNTQLEGIEKLKQQQPYTTTGEIVASYADENDADTQAQLDEVLGNLKVTVDGKYDATQEIANTSYKLLYGTQNLFQLDTAQNGTLYGAKCEEIVAQYYMGIRNEDLKVFFQKLGINSTQIPDSIETSNLSSTLKFTDEEIQAIQDTYLPVIQTTISEDNYTKQSDMLVTKNGVEYNTTAYRVDLSGTEVTTLVTNILQTLQQDSITLNLIATKAKALGLAEQYTSVNELNSLISDLLTNINDKLEYFKDGISIVQYVDDGETISTEIIIKNQVKITIDAEKANTSTQINITLENLSSSEEYTTATISMQLVETSTQTLINVSIDIDGETQVNVSMQVDGDASLGSVVSTYRIEGIESEITMALEYKETTEFVTELEDTLELDNTKNCIVLNDYDTANLQALLPAIMQRTLEVLQEKILLVQTNINQTIQNSISGDITDGLPQGTTVTQPIQ